MREMKEKLWDEEKFCPTNTRKRTERMFWIFLPLKEMRWRERVWEEGLDTL